MKRQLLNKLINEGDVDPSYGKKFYSGVCHSYEVCMNYIKRTLPLNDDLLLHAKVIDIKQRDAAKFESIEFFYAHLQFLSVLNYCRKSVAYQLLRDSDIMLK